MTTTERTFTWQPAFPTYRRVKSHRGKVAHLVTDSDLTHPDLDAGYRPWPPTPGEPVCCRSITEGRPAADDDPVCQVCTFVVEEIVNDRVERQAWCELQGPPWRGCATST